MSKMTVTDKIERLRPHCEYVMLHAYGDGWTVVDLLHGAVGISVKYTHGERAEIHGPSLDFVLDQVWNNRPQENRDHDV